ncbi:MAG: TlpA family protein disulfide reductase [Acidobacteria bacterium]|jgi:thiol-disulfide isomerase/thioredoxin|nr:MAG: TlpA family protein disulfide reductase [Acidobacteriota bacterium]
MTNTQRYVMGAAAAMAAIALVALAVRYTRNVGTSLSGGPTRTVQFVKNPTPVPEMTFQDIDGRTMSTRDWKGKVVLVNFWATWCPPCREEIPAFVAMQERYRDDLLIVGVSMDEGSLDDVRQFARDHKMNYPIVMQTAELHKSFPGVFALPTTFVIDPELRTVQKHVGLINPEIYELETRVLAGLSEDINVEQVEDTGRVLLSNAAQATELPGLDMSGLRPEQKTVALKRLNEEGCTCGCMLTIAQCRINDASCVISPPLAQKIVDEVRGN